MDSENQVFQTETNGRLALLPATETQGETHATGVESEAHNLLKRTPGSYLLNQVYGLWFFVSWFVLTILITQALTNSEYGAYSIAMSAFNTIAYIVAFGLEDASTTFLPRLLAEHGPGSAAQLMRRLLGLRTLTLLLTLLILLFAMPALASLIGLFPGQWASDTAAGLRSPTLLGHITPIAFYVLGNGITSLQTAFCASYMRMRLVFVIGGITQVLLLLLGYIVLKLGWSVDGMLWLLAISSLLSSVAFLIWQAPLLLKRGATYTQSLQPVIRLGFSAWQNNLVTGALLKQVVIILLGTFAVSLTEIGYFNLSYQLGHTASLLLVTGFGGVAGSALAAAFVGRNYARLARAWETLIKIETFLAAPVLIFCLFNASAIAYLLYGSRYAPVGPLLALFLGFHLLIRALGTTIHPSTLYVTGKAWQVALGQWLGLLALILFGIVLIPRLGPAGALIADGLAQLVTGCLMLAFLWRVLPRRYPLGFTLRLLPPLLVAALPGLLPHPAGRGLMSVLFLVGLGLIFLAVSVGLLARIRPLSAEDVEMIKGMRPQLAKYVHWLARQS